MELTTVHQFKPNLQQLFMMSKIQNLNGTHNTAPLRVVKVLVVYDVKDTKFEWNSQLRGLSAI